MRFVTEAGHLLTIVHHHTAGNDSFSQFMSKAFKAAVLKLSGNQYINEARCLALN